VSEVRAFCSSTRAEAMTAKGLTGDRERFKGTGVLLDSASPCLPRWVVSRSGVWSETMLSKRFDAQASASIPQAIGCVSEVMVRCSTIQAAGRSGVLLEH
jgi:hypothetical protein